MTSATLQRQNLAMKTSLDNTKRENEELREARRAATSDAAVHNQLPDSLARPSLACSSQRRRSSCRARQTRSPCSIALDRNGDAIVAAGRAAAGRRGTRRLGPQWSAAAVAAPSPPSGASWRALKQQRFEGLLAGSSTRSPRRAPAEDAAGGRAGGGDPEAAKRATAMAEGDAARAEALSVKLQAEQASTAAQLHARRSTDRGGAGAAATQTAARVSRRCAPRSPDRPALRLPPAACCCARVLRWAGARADDRLEQTRRSSKKTKEPTGAAEAAGVVGLPAGGAARRRQWRRRPPRRRRPRGAPARRATAVRTRARRPPPPPRPAASRAKCRALRGARRAAEAGRDAAGRGEREGARGGQAARAAARGVGRPRE